MYTQLPEWTLQRTSISCGKHHAFFASHQIVPLPRPKPCRNCCATQTALHRLSTRNIHTIPNEIRNSWGCVPYQNLTTNAGPVFGIHKRSYSNDIPPVSTPAFSAMETSRATSIFWKYLFSWKLHHLELIFHWISPFIDIFHFSPRIFPFKMPILELERPPRQRSTSKRPLHLAGNDMFHKSYALVNVRITMDNHLS